MKPHTIVIASFIALLCLLIFGLRGLDAAVVSVGTFFAGVAVQKKEQAVVAEFDRLKSKFKDWF